LFFRRKATTACNICNLVFVQPGFIYGCWVVIGATAYADQIDSGSSFSGAYMSANVSSLVFDTLF
jgi:hypothetical protein